MTITLLVVLWGLRLLVVLALLYVALCLAACLVADLRNESGPGGAGDDSLMVDRS